jgi:NAD(P)-dependent dehydrogenase (short-subunit alcohol dehydrogenase family)
MSDVSYDFTGKVVVVTGGSRGIGAALVWGFARSGADVVIASRKADSCEELAIAVRRETGRQATAVGCHVGMWDDCDRLMDTVEQTHGRCDVFVNNAGMSPLYPDLMSISESYWDKVTGVNLKGPFRLGVRAGTLMASGDGGSIINVGTIGSLRPGSNELVYACAKAGLNALTIGLSEAFAPKVRVNALLPGGVDTDVTKAWSVEMKAHAAAITPLGRLGLPDDYVGPALWLASSASGWVTGTVIRVDGGACRQM